GGGPWLPLAPVPTDAASGVLGLDGAIARHRRGHRGRTGPAGASRGGHCLSRPLGGPAGSLWPWSARAARGAGYWPRAGGAALAPTRASQRAAAVGPAWTPSGAPGRQT